MLKLLVRIYAGTVFLVAAWAWVVEIIMHQSSKEHMLPATLLMITSMPLSLAGGPLIIMFPFLADSPFAPLFIFTFAGILQAAAVIAAQHYVYRNKRMGER